MVTVREIVTEMEARYGKSERIWVMDRGMVSESNLSWYSRMETGSGNVIVDETPGLNHFLLLPGTGGGVECGVGDDGCWVADGAPLCADIFADDFESGDTSGWALTVQ